MENRCSKCFRKGAVSPEYDGHVLLCRACRFQVFSVVAFLEYHNMMVSPIEQLPLPYEPSAAQKFASEELDTNPV